MDLKNVSPYGSLNFSNNPKLFFKQGSKISKIGKHFQKSAKISNVHEFKIQCHRTHSSCVSRLFIVLNVCDVSHWCLCSQILFSIVTIDDIKYGAKFAKNKRKVISPIVDFFFANIICVHY